MKSGVSLTRDLFGRIVRAEAEVGGAAYLARRMWFGRLRPAGWGGFAFGPTRVRMAVQGIESDLVAELLGRLEDGPDDGRGAFMAKAVRDMMGRETTRWLDRIAPGIWTGSDAAYYGRALLGRRRRARIEAAPALRRLAFVDGFRCDPGKALIRGVPPFSARKADAARFRAVAGGALPFETPEAAWTALSMPPEWLPVERGGERVAFETMSAAAAPLIRVTGSCDILAGGRWSAHLGTLQARYPGRSLEGLCADAVDPLRALGEQLVAPALYRLGHGEPHHGASGLSDRLDGTTARIAARILYGEKRLAGILALSDRWHARMAGYRPRDGISAEAWPVAFPDIAAPNGVLIRGLGSAEALAREGRELGHCVGGYVSACRSGRSAILSLRGADGVPLSTAELGIGESRIVQRQHRGVRNADPPAAAREALAWLLAENASGNLPANEAVLVPRGRGASFEVPPCHVSDEAYAERIARWSFLLPRHARDPEGFEAAVREAVESRILPLAGGRSNLAGRRFLASRYGLPSSPWDFLSRGVLGAPGRAVNGVYSAIRSHPTVMAMRVRPDGTGALARFLCEAVWGFGSLALLAAQLSAPVLATIPESRGAGIALALAACFGLPWAIDLAVSALPRPTRRVVGFTPRG